MTPEELAYYSNLRMQEKFREAMGPYKDGDWCLDSNDNKPGFAIDAEFLNSADRNGARVPIRLPLPIDRDNPERGLLGIVQEFTDMYYLFNEWTIVTHGGKRDFTGETPTLALLKALAHQWGIEVEG